MKNVKQANRESVLYLLNNKKRLSRKDIADELGLTPAAVTKISAELINEGAIYETGISQGENKAGRKKIMLRLNTENIFALTVSIEFDACFIAVCSLDGKAVKRSVLRSQNGADPKEYLEAVADEAIRLIDISGVEKSEIIGAGVGIVGSADIETGETAGAYGMWKNGINVKKIFEEKLAMPVIVENNVKAFAGAQMIFESKNPDENILFVKWGPGVGSAIVIGGEVFNGNGNSAAEIGHYIVHPNGIKCRCGRRGCLETHVSAGAIVDKIKEHYSESETPRLYAVTGGNIDRVSFSVIRENKDNLDKCIDGIIDRRINRMARAVTNAATIINPDKVVIFGYMFDEKTAKRFVECCKDYYDKFDEKYISVSPLQDKSDFIGPLALAAKKLFFEKT